MRECAIKDYQDNQGRKHDHTGRMMRTEPTFIVPGTAERERHFYPLQEDVSNGHNVIHQNGKLTLRTLFLSPLATDF